MPGTEYLVQQLNHATTYLISACHHYPEITQSCTFAALIRLSTTTHNLFTFPRNEISSNWQINTSTHLSYIRLIQGPGCTVTLLAHQHKFCTVFTPKKKILARQVKLHLQFCSRPIDLTPRTLFLRPKT